VRHWTGGRCSEGSDGGNWRCVCRITQAELLDDVAANAFCGAGGEGGDGASGKISRKRLSWRYSGRNSWPHSEMQWASSMAKKETGMRFSQSVVLLRRSLRRQIEQLVFAGSGLLEDVGAPVRGSGGVQAGSGNAHLESCATWSCISAMSGRSRRRASIEHGGKLVAERLPPPVA